MLIDTHAHVNFNTFKDDSFEIIQKSLDNDVWMINVGSQYTTSKRAVAMAEKYKEGVYAAVGLHPIYAAEEFDPEKYKELAKSKKVAAIGEIGLDYKQEYVSLKNEQKVLLDKQLKLAEELDLPVILHCRMAYDDLMAILRPQVKGVMHCFTGNWEQAQQCLDKGLYLGFNGIIFKLNIDEVIEKAPLDKILVETDCPYLTPPMAEAKRNEPMFVKYVVEKIAKIKGLSYNEISRITSENAKKLFKI